MIHLVWPLIQREIVRRDMSNSVLDAAFIKKCIKYLKESFSFYSIERILEIGPVKYFLERLDQLNCLNDTCSHLTHHVETRCDYHGIIDICNVHRHIMRSELKNKRKKLREVENDLKYEDNFCSHGSFNLNRDRVLIKFLCLQLRTIEDSDCGISRSCYEKDLSNILTTKTKNRSKSISDNIDLPLNSDTNSESTNTLRISKFLYYYILNYRKRLDY